MTDDRKPRFIRLVPFCDFRCRICRTIGCTSSSLVTEREMQECIVHLTSDNIGRIVLPPNSVHHPRFEYFTSAVRTHGIAVRVLVTVGDSDESLMEVVDNLQASGCEIELLIESELDRSKSRLLMTLNARPQADVTFTYVLSRDSGTAKSFASIPTELYPSLQLFSPSKRDLSDLAFTSDEIFEFLEYLRFKHPDFKISNSSTLESVYSTSSPFDSRERNARELMCPLQEQFRSSLDIDLYLKNVEVMGQFPRLRTFVNRSLNVKLVAKFMESIYISTESLQLKMYATWIPPIRTSPKPYRPGRHAASVQAMKAALRPRAVFFGGVRLLGCARVGIIRLRFLFIHCIRLGVIRLYWNSVEFRHGIRRLQNQIRWFCSSPNSWTAAHFPTLQFVFFQPILKTYYFLRYQFNKRIRRST